MGHHIDRYVHYGMLEFTSLVMTQRHDDSDDETYVTVGRPFERLETADDMHKAKARKDKDQYVTDSQGRRRFHGAFTGGFSAGYYNTVGSKEGKDYRYIDILYLCTSKWCGPAFLITLLDLKLYSNGIPYGLDSKC